MTKSSGGASRTYLLYGILALAVIVWLVGGWSSDRRQIERQLDRFRSLVEKDSGESALTGASKARGVGELLTRDFALHLEPYASAITDRQRLTQLVLGYRNRASQIGLSFRDQELALDERLRIGDMTVEAVITGQADGTGFREGYRLRIQWVTEDEAWRMRRVDLLEILDSPSWL